MNYLKFLMSITLYFFNFAPASLLRLQSFLAMRTAQSLLSTFHRLQEIPGKVRRPVKLMQTRSSALMSGTLPFMVISPSQDQEKSQILISIIAILMPKP